MSAEDASRDRAAHAVLLSSPRRLTPHHHNAYRVADLPDGTGREVIDLVASDGAASQGLLHLPPAPRGSAVAVFMHPRTQQTRPYLAPDLLRAGIAVWGQSSRDVNNDTDMTHEEVLLDCAAGMRMLRDRGFDTVILVGNSGGGSLLASYQAQAARAPERRWATSPARDPTGFADEDMPTASHLVLLAAHPGEGRVALDALDAAVVDEDDPTIVDPELDLYAPANGYRPFPEPSRYDAEWLVAYREAQRARCRRLDARARAEIEARQVARTQLPVGLPSPAVARRAMLERYLVIYGTLANPAYLDPSISPSDRPMGTLFAPGHPLAQSLGPGGLARVLTPRAWLSSWSGLSSQAMLANVVHELTLPCLFVYPEADTEVFIDDQTHLFDRCPAEDKTFESIPYAQHYLTALPEHADLEDPRRVAGRLVCDWLGERLP